MEFEHRRRGPQPVLTPLIDVVFLLLVFFLLTGSFARRDLFPVRPPVADSETPAGTGELTILITRDGRVALDQQTVRFADLGDRLAERIRSTNTEAVTVTADADTPTGAVMAVLALARRVGAGQVRLVTLPRDTTR